MDNFPPNRVLIIDDEENMRHMLASALGKEGFVTACAADGRQGLALAGEQSFDCILCDLKMPGMDGLEFLARAGEQELEATIIMMSAFATVDTAVQAMRQGAYDFITKPFKIEAILCTLHKALERDQLQRENRRLKESLAQLQGRHGFAAIVGESPSLGQVLALAEKAARYDTTVLITGESGTGKEMVAKGIQQLSARATGPFVSINCASIPEGLLESEFFGFIKGSFTDAHADRQGLFESANGGTLFLDEIGELPLGLQVKLLRVLQEREVRPIGASRSRKIDVRLLAATAKNLQEEVSKGAFRQDLYFRLNVISLSLPPLRERSEDIPLLGQYFLEQAVQRMGCGEKRLASETMRLLLAYPWPGNVRELENCLERAVVVAEGENILPEDLPEVVFAERQKQQSEFTFSGYSLRVGKKQLEKKLIARALGRTGGNKSQAAVILELSYPALLGKIREYGLDSGREGESGAPNNFAKN